MREKTPEHCLEERILRPRHLANHVLRRRQPHGTRHVHHHGELRTLFRGGRGAADGRFQVGVVVCVHPPTARGGERVRGEAVLYARWRRRRRRSWRKLIETDLAPTAAIRLAASPVTAPFFACRSWHGRLIDHARRRRRLRGARHTYWALIALGGVADAARVVIAPGRACLRIRSWRVRRIGHRRARRAAVPQLSALTAS